jgi:anti-anti-sigma factor
MPRRPTLLEVREIAPGLLHVAGSVDLDTVAYLRERFIEAIDRAVSDGMPTLSVDLHDVTSMDAVGLGVLLGAHRRARRGGGSLRLVRINASLLDLLHTSRLYRVLDIAHDEPLLTGRPARL